MDNKQVIEILERDIDRFKDADYKQALSHAIEVMKASDPKIREVNKYKLREDGNIKKITTNTDVLLEIHKKMCETPEAREFMMRHLGIKKEGE
jgi:hypothetical protein